MNGCTTLVHRLTRRKHVNWKRIRETNLARCLTTLDLTALGIGSTLGAGAYVITGQVAKNDAGPGVIVSFLLAAVASVLAGICYAEFGARVPKTGSAYIYTYVTVGEGMAFVIGWNLLLEYVIGTASVARTFSGYLDFLVGGMIRPWLNSSMPINVPTLAPYADPVALGIILIVTVLLTIGVKESATVNKFFTGLNLLVIAFVVIAGAFKNDVSNWHLPKPNITVCGHDRHSSCGEGGFSPFGFHGIVKGAATAFYAYIGFDAIATTGEEVKNPHRAIPLSIMLSLLIVFIVYFLISITVTMMEPYYLLDVDAPLARIFQNSGWAITKHLISAGAICALSTSLLGSMFPMPRVILAMARDGLVFRFLGRVNHKFKTPIWATVLSGILAAIMAFLFDVESLVSMMSIGTLLAYTLVSSCVLILRYEIELEQEDILLSSDSDCTSPRLSPKIPTLRPIENSTSTSFIRKLLKPSLKSPSATSACFVKVLVVITVIEISALSVFLTAAEEAIYHASPWALLTVLAFLLALFITGFLIYLQPPNAKKLSFEVPLVPLVPIISAFFNIYLMVQLDYMTFVRFVVWMAVGFAIYFSYGIVNSSEETGISYESDMDETDNAVLSRAQSGLNKSSYRTDGSSSTALLKSSKSSFASLK